MPVTSNPEFVFPSGIKFDYQTSQHPSVFVHFCNFQEQWALQQSLVVSILNP